MNNIELKDKNRREVIQFLKWLKAQQAIQRGIESKCWSQPVLQSLDQHSHLCYKKGLHEHDLPVLSSRPEFSNGGSGTHTNRGAMPELLEPPVARAGHDSKSVGCRSLPLEPKTHVHRISGEESGFK
jgi:hypothetical protein